MDGSYSRSRYELENKCVIHSGCVVVVWSLMGLWISTVVEIDSFDCCDNCSRVQREGVKTDGGLRRCFV
jgi:hypothetical protein